MKSLPLKRACENLVPVGLRILVGTGCGYTGGLETFGDEGGNARLRFD